MNYINNLFPDDLLHALGWTVLHSLWQGVLIALILAVVMISLQKKSSKLRYLIANIGLLLMLFTSIISFFIIYQQAPINQFDGINRFTIAPEHSETNLIAIMGDYFNRNLPLIVSVWFMGVAFFILRMLGGLAYIQHLKYKHTQALSPYWQDKMHELAFKINIKQPVQLLESALVKVPMVLGYLKPVILMPIGAVNGLTEEQVEAILAHELAHIYRNDYLLNILQSLIETLFYFNPAVWWISANIRMERENCCDDLAVELCGNSLAYAKALVSLQEMHQGAPAFAMPFSSPKNQLLNRVKRILNQPQNKSNIMEKLTATSMLLVAMLMLSFGANPPLEYLTKLNDENPEIHFHFDEIETLDILKHDDGSTIIAHLAPLDSIPKNKKTKKKTYIRKENGRNMEIVIENDEVKKLKIDGETIPKEQFAQYEEEIENMKEELSEIPPPPPPPAAPKAPNAPSAVLPPPPPPPPAPPGFGKRESRKIISTKDEDGNTMIIIEEKEGEDPVEIKIEEGEGHVRAIIIDGETIETLGENDVVVLEEILEEVPAPNLFNFHREMPLQWKFDNNATLAPSDFFKGELDWDAYAVLPEIKYDEWLKIAEGGDVEGKIKEFFPNMDQNIWTVPNPESNYFVLPDASFKSQEESAEYRAWWERWQEELSERMKDGNISKEWMEKWEKEFKEKWPNNSLNLWMRDKPNSWIWGGENNLEYVVPKGKLRGKIKPQSLKRFNGSLMDATIAPGSIYSNDIFPSILYSKDFDDGILMTFEQEMLLDKLIEKGQLKSFELSGKSFKINGKKQDEKYFKKYLKLLEKQQGRKLKKKSKILYNLS